MIYSTMFSTLILSSFLHVQAWKFHMDKKNKIDQYLNGLNSRYEKETEKFQQLLADLDSYSQSRMVKAQYFDGMVNVSDKKIESGNHFPGFDHTTLCRRLSNIWRRPHGCK